MASVSQAVGDFGQSVIDAAKSVGRSITGRGAGTSAYNPALDYVQSPFRRSVQPYLDHASNGVEAVGGGIKGTIKGSLKTGWYIGTRPIVWAIETAGYGLRKMGGFYESHRGPAWVLTAIAATVGLGAYVSHRTRKNAEAETALKVGALQQMALAQQQPTYRLEPGEFTTLAAPRMRDSLADGVPASAGHADRFLAARQQAAAPQQAGGTPVETANLANL